MRGQRSIPSKVTFDAVLVNGTVVLESLNPMVRVAGSTALTTRFTARIQITPLPDEWDTP